MLQQVNQRINWPALIAAKQVTLTPDKEAIKTHIFPNRMAHVPTLPGVAALVAFLSPKFNLFGFGENGLRSILKQLREGRIREAWVLMLLKDLTFINAVPALEIADALAWKEPPLVGKWGVYWWVSPPDCLADDRIF